MNFLDSIIFLNCALFSRFLEVSGFETSTQSFASPFHFVAFCLTQACGPFSVCHRTQGYQIGKVVCQLSRPELEALLSLYVLKSLCSINFVLKILLLELINRFSFKGNQHFCKKFVLSLFSKKF